jgi:signal transduction histidine kinase
VVANIDDSPAEKRLEEQKFNSRLLQIYSPIRKSGTNQVIAVAEFYQKVSSLEADVASAQCQSRLVVGSIMAVMYLLLVGFVRRADTTIRKQEAELTQQVDRLTELLAQNKELHQRVQRAAANATALNERFLRRISADLHDGPTQVLGLALLRLDRVVGQNEVCRLQNPGAACNEQLPIIQTSLQQAMQEMRAIAAGFGLPQLENLSFAELLKRVVRSHEQRTGTRVEVSYDPIPEPLDLPIKIAAYRLIQEALNNAYRHAAGIGQSVRIEHTADSLVICVSDQGSGFDVARQLGWGEHLGLSGMRGRVESLGGSFRIESEAGHGTRVTAQLPLQPVGEVNHG